MKSRWREISCKDCGRWMWTSNNDQLCDTCRDYRANKPRAHTEYEKKFKLIFDPNPDDIAFVPGGLFHKIDLDCKWFIGCVFENTKTGEVIKV